MQRRQLSSAAWRIFGICWSALKFLLEQSNGSQRIHNVVSAVKQEIRAAWTVVAVGASERWIKPSCSKELKVAASACRPTTAQSKLTVGQRVLVGMTTAFSIPKNWGESLKWQGGNANIDSLILGKRYLSVTRPTLVEVMNTKEEGKFSIAETALFLQQNKFAGTWSEIVLPSLKNMQFSNALFSAIEGLSEGSAYAAQFVSSSEGRFISLGSSFIISRGASHSKIRDHLKEVLAHYEESYNEVFDGAMVLRIKCIGDAAELGTKIIMKQSGIKESVRPWGPIGRTLDLPIPMVDFKGLYQSMSFRFSELGHKGPLSATLEMLKLDAASFNLQDWLVTAGENNLSMTNRLTGSMIQFNPSSGEGVYVHYRSNTMYEFRDVPQTTDIVKRRVGNATIYIASNTHSMMGWEYSHEQKRFISTVDLKRDGKVDPTSFVVADIEGLIRDRKWNVPYLAEWYGVAKGNKEIGGVFKLQDYNMEPKSMLQAFWRSIIDSRPGTTVYFHNWAGYDAYHALDALVTLSLPGKMSFKPLMHNGQLINLAVLVQAEGETKPKMVLNIKDSIKILPGALGRLAKDFNVETLKEHFPHYFALPEFGELNYEGAVPAYEYFEPKRTSHKEWLELQPQFPNNDWNYMRESLKYLHADCKALFQVLIAFFNDVYNNFKVNPQKNVSIPGVAFKNWKGNYLPDLQKKEGITVCDLSHDYDAFLREGYLGGIVDVYKPYVKDAYYYDVNSLYPTAMKCLMPVGTPRFQTLSVDEFLNSPWFGFVRATVKAPDNLHIGVLAIRRDGKLVTPAGVFTGTFFSEELRFAIEHGYTLLSIEYGYAFGSAFIFDKYVDKLNAMKIQAQLDGKPSLRAIAKLLMNSSYGRFGMHPHDNVVRIVDSATATKIAASYSIVRDIEFSNGTSLIEYIPYPFAEAISSGLIKASDVPYFTEAGKVASQTNVPIAAAITAYSRMIINRFKLLALADGNDVIYSDTDSLVVQRPLPSSWVSPTELGLLKLEHKIREAFFIAPKLYYLECEGKDGAIYTVSKSRGYGGQLTRSQIETLYQGSAICVNKHKWYRSWKLHTVYFDMDSKLNITGTFSKREKIFSYDHIPPLPKPPKLEVPSLESIMTRLSTEYPRHSVQQLNAFALKEQAALLAQYKADHTAFINAVSAYSKALNSSVPRWISTRPIVLNDPVVKPALPHLFETMLRPGRPDQAAKALSGLTSAPKPQVSAGQALFAKPSVDLESRSADFMATVYASSFIRRRVAKIRGTSA